MILWYAIAWAVPPAIAPPLTQGELSTITLVDENGTARGGLSVSMLYHPGLPDQQEIPLGITDSLGRIRLTPEQAGAASLRVDHELWPVRIQYSEFPTPTALLLGGLLILGGTAIGIGIARRRRT